MSWYYTYYLGYKNKEDNKIYPLGPFDRDGSWLNVFSASSSFASDLYQSFRPLNKEDMSDEMLKSIRNDFDLEDGEEIPEWDLNLYTILPLKDLPRGSYSKTRYCLTSTVMEAVKDGITWDLASELSYESLTLEEYAVKAEAELKTGTVPKQYDIEGEEFPTHSCKDYTLFTWVDTSSPEYESWLIRLAADMFEFSDVIYKEGNEIVVICSQG